METENQFPTFFSTLLAVLKDSAENPVGPIEFIKRTIRGEIFYIVFKALVGLVLAATTVYSIFHMGEAFRVWASQFENPFVLELIGFGILAVITSVALYFLFQIPSRKLAPRGFNYELIAIKFAEGFLESLEAQAQHKDDIQPTPRSIYN